MMVITNENLIPLMVVSIFMLGGLTFMLGVFVLVSKAMGREVRTLAAQTSQLAQKGISDDVSGLVGNATALMNALQQLVRTATGIGAFLIVTGAALMATTLWLTQQLGWATWIAT